MADRSSLRLSLASLDQRWEDKDGNFERCRALASDARAAGADVIVFPEMTLTGFSVDTTATAEPPTRSESIARFRELARASGIGVVFGVTLQQGRRAANTLVYVTSAGRVAARYAKIHPFSFAGEDRLFVRGDKLATATIGPMRVGFTICYDLRFPELYTALARKCDLIVNIANWPTRRVHHWRTLLTARAIENQVYVAGVNRTGTDGKGHSYEKSSVVVDANGDNLAPVASAGAELDTFDVSATALAAFRSRFHTTPDRLPALYRKLI